MSQLSTSKRLICAMAVMAVMISADAGYAQQDPGARAGTAYVPSTHTAGCGGVLCDGNSPERAVGAPPPPPCEGLICGISPYSMQRPLTASEAQRMREEQARAPVPAATPSEAASTPSRKHRSKAKSAKKAARDRSVATRTPDPGGAAPAQ